MVLVSTVTFSDGKSDTQLITGVKPGQSDEAHHAHQREQARFWGDWKRVTGGRYQAHDSLVDALYALPR
jgi:hypothetical protein